MRLLIIGGLQGQIGAATKIAMSRGAKVTHAGNIEQASAELRAGRGADLFESTAAENIGAMILGVAVYSIASASNWPHPEAWIFFPLVVRAFGLLATIISIQFFIRGREDEDPMNILNRGYWATTVLSVIGLAITTYVMMDSGGATSHGLPTWVWFFGAGVVGLATSVAFVYITQYYTAGSFRPVREIAEASMTFRSLDKTSR